ncbi:Autophagy protein 7, partial [Perkinsus olseni]
MATLQHDPGPYDDKNTWQAGDSLKPDYRLSRMTRADREAVWDTVTLPRRAQRQYEERRHEQLHGRAHLVGRYDGTPSTSSFREDNPARRGAHGRRVYDTQVRPEPLPPAISGIDTVPVEGILRRQESEFEKGLRDRGLGPGFRQYMPRANEPRSKYHNMATRDLGLDAIIHDKPRPEAATQRDRGCKPFATFTRPLDASDMDRRIPVGPLPCCKTLKRRVVRSFSAAMLPCINVLITILMPTTQVEFSSPVLQLDTEFWRELADYKLNVQRLGTSAIPTSGEIPSHDPSRILCSGLKEKELSNEIGSCCSGRVYNYNTIQDFARVDRQSILNSLTHSILSAAFSSSSEPQPLLYFVVICYADLKNFKFTYNCAVPRLAFKTPLIVTSSTAAADPIETSTLSRLSKEMVLLRHEDGTLSNLSERSTSPIAEVLVLVAA